MHAAPDAVKAHVAVHTEQGQGAAAAARPAPGVEVLAADLRALTEVVHELVAHTGEPVSEEVQSVCRAWSRVKNHSTHTGAVHTDAWQDGQRPSPNPNKQEGMRQALYEQILQDKGRDKHTKGKARRRAESREKWSRGQKCMLAEVLPKPRDRPSPRGSSAAAQELGGVGSNPGPKHSDPKPAQKCVPTEVLPKPRDRVTEDTLATSEPRVMEEVMREAVADPHSDHRDAMNPTVHPAQSEEEGEGTWYSAMYGRASRMARRHITT